MVKKETKKYVAPVRKVIAKVEEPKVEEPKVDIRKLYFRCIVNPLLAEGNDRNNPIPVNDLGDLKTGRAVCYPNQECVLTQVQINILNDAVETTRLPVEEGSGIYEAANPMAEAEKQFPGFKAVLDRNTNKIMLKKSKSRFSVNILGPYKPE